MELLVDRCEGEITLGCYSYATTNTRQEADSTERTNNMGFSVMSRAISNRQKQQQYSLSSSVTSVVSGRKISSPPSILKYNRRPESTGVGVGGERSVMDKTLQETGAKFDTDTPGYKDDTNFESEQKKRKKDLKVLLVFPPNPLQIGGLASLSAESKKLHENTKNKDEDELYFVGCIRNIRINNEVKIF